MTREFRQIAWDEATRDDCRHVVRLAVREDLARGFDLTTLALVAAEARGAAAVVVRQQGVIAGLPAARLALAEMDIPADWQPQVADGDRVAAGTTVARLAGPARDLLTAERILLNLLGRLSGVATRTRQYVDAVAGTRARIYDTRKTTPAWRRLEKYAVRCGGGCNHRTGLFDAVLIKDNHLAQAGLTPAQAVRQVREFLTRADLPGGGGDVLVEVEIDSLDGFDELLSAAPDIILLDNMPPATLRQAVARRDAAAADCQLEASGGIRLATVREVAETGVDRISVGDLTHSVSCLDVALDWLDG